jgi:hypothetical protein
MALQSMTALASITLQEASASVTFSGIPQNYRDLILVMNPAVAALTIPNYQINGLTSSIYSHVGAVGYFSTTASYSGTEGSGRLQQQQSVQVGQVIYTVQFIDYSVTNKHKSTLIRQSQSNGDVSMTAGRVATLDVITSIEILSGINNFLTGSTFNLYGRIA